jgi:hypothetical protein
MGGKRIKRDTIVIKPPFGNFIDLQKLKAGVQHEIKVFLENGLETYHTKFTARTLPKTIKSDHHVYAQIP